MRRSGVRIPSLAPYFYLEGVGVPLDQFELKVLKFIENHQLITPNSRVLVALSGGIDSVSLLHVLIKLRKFLKIELCAAHLNHMIRESALRDEEFVKDLCNKLSVKLYIDRVDVPAFCAKKKIGIEEGARILRYEFFERVLRESGSDLLALGHNLNDLAETILYRLARGTSFTGLVCMYPKDGYKIRPFLYFKRQQIESYAKQNFISHVEDETNLDTSYTRNYIRHRILPLLKNLNDDVENTLRQIHFSAILLKDHISGILERYADRIHNFQNRIILDLDGMDKFEIVEMIKFCLEKFHVQINYRQIDRIVSSLDKSSWAVDLTKEIRVSKGFEFISIETKRPFVEELQISFEGTYNFNGWIFELSREIKSDDYIFVDPHYTIIRTRKKGDRVFNEKLKDIFIDSRVPQFLRDEIPIVCIQNQIIWVPGVYLNNSFREKKNNLLVLNLLNDPYSCILKERSERRKKV